MGLGILSVGLAGCGSTSATAPSSSGSGKPTVTIGYENAPDPEAVAIEQKFFQKYMHANVQMKYFASGPSALTALASGSLDFMTTIGNPPVVSAIAKGVPLKVVWAMERYTTAEGLVVKKGSGITSLHSLVGKKVALVSGSTSPFELYTALKNHGISPNSVTMQNMTPSEMVSAWKTNQIQAAYVWVPFLTSMQQAGGHVLITDQNQAASAPIFNLAVVNSSWAKSHKSLVDGFVKAEQAGVTFYHKHPNQSYADMGKLNSISTASAKSQAQGFAFSSLSQQLTSRRLGTTSTVSSSLVTKSLTSAAHWLYTTGQISTLPHHLSKYVDPSFAQTVSKGG